jgi:hypothetical protein
VVFRYRGQLFVTIVVKGTFTLVAARPMAPTLPEPIVRGEHAFDTGVGPRTAGDLVPFRPQVDVLGDQFLLGMSDAMEEGAAPEDVRPR